MIKLKYMYVIYLHVLQETLDQSLVSYTCEIFYYIYYLPN